MFYIGRRSICVGSSDYTVEGVYSICAGSKCYIVERVVFEKGVIVI